MNGNGFEAKQAALGERDITLPVLFLSSFFAVIKRPWIVILTVLMIMVPVTYILFSREPLYESKAKVMVSIKGASILDELSFATGSPNRSSEKTAAYYLSLLDSREYKKKVAARMRETFPQMPADTIDAYIDGLEFQTRPREEEFITIKAVSPSPRVAYALANFALEEFKNRSIMLEREEGEKIADFIEEQIELTSANMERAERDLQNFLADKKLIIDDTEAGIGKELFDLERQYSEAMAGLEMVRINIESYNKQISDLLDKLTVAKNGSRVDNDITKLRDQLASIKKDIINLNRTGGNEARIRELQDEREQILSELVQLTVGTGNSDNGDNSNSILSLHELQRQLDMALLDEVQYKNKTDFYRQKISRFKKDHPNLPKDMLEYARLKRAKDVLEKTLDILLENREEARIRVAAEQGGVKVIDEPAFPTEPIAENKIVKTMLSLIISIVLGIIISTLADYFDSTIRDENDVRKLGVSPLGSIPVFTPDAKREKREREREKKKIKGVKTSENLRNRKMLIFESQRSYVAEAYRSLKISLQFSASDQGKSVFVISSAGVGEGKSLTTANLAVAFAQGGKKTLVIDLDLRRSTQNRYFEVARKPGISEYLLNNIAFEDILRDTGVPNLTLIPSGSSPPNPAELVASRAMARFVEKVRQEYDIVFIDSPPILVCTDAMSVAEHADGMIIMVRMEHTNAKTLEYAIDTVKNINIDIMGAILNHTSYRYGTTYYYFYRYYRPYTYYSTYRYYSYYYGDAEQDYDGTGYRKKKHRRKRSAEKKREMVDTHDDKA